jgi:sugar phosphate isomerase/epimerase
LAALLERYDMMGGYHNHSGGNNVGAPLWDLHRLIEAVDSDHFGSNFDVGHATVEGGAAGWQINARLMAPHVRMMAVKDFLWVDKKVRWVPLGEGQVPTVEILKMVRAAGFAGPVSLHFEYDVASDDAMLEEIRRSAGILREYLRLAGYG